VYKRQRLINAINSGEDIFDRGEKFQIVNMQQNRDFPLYLMENIEAFGNLIKENDS
jgi:hypothetical protein